MTLHLSTLNLICHLAAQIASWSRSCCKDVTSWIELTGLQSFVSSANTDTLLIIPSPKSFICYSALESSGELYIRTRNTPLCATGIRPLSSQALRFSLF
ncbi:hypothetical protein XENTR_v10001125 [Xenopus tropicalis]|nr:hypothetical protein XENTR_v10001125 [Xenopus tropicalis]